MNNRTLRLAFGPALIGAAVVALAASAASAQEPKAGDDERMAELPQSVDEARERLQLSNEQVDQLLPLLRESFEATRAILEKHGINVSSMAEGGSNRRLNFRQLRALSRDLDEVQETMFDKTEELGFLSDEQFTEFKKIQEEQRAALRERLRARRGSPLQPDR